MANIKVGDLVVYMGGLFRVTEILLQSDAKGNTFTHTRLGNMWITGTCRKADWRDINKIVKVT